MQIEICVISDQKDYEYLIEKITSKWGDKPILVVQNRDVADYVIKAIHQYERRLVLDELVKESEQLGFYKDNFVKDIKEN